MPEEGTIRLCRANEYGMTKSYSKYDLELVSLPSRDRRFLPVRLVVLLAPVTYSITCTVNFRPYERTKQDI